MRSHEHRKLPLGTKPLAWAIAINVLLTVAQVMGGLLSGSLSLIADALHNLSDAGGLTLAVIARYVSRRAPDEKRTFGYGMAEVVGGLINLTSIIVIAGFLMIEALTRSFDHPEIMGWPVVFVAGIALVVDLATAALTYSMSKESLNIKAAFLHNVSDALASVAVIASGALVILFGWYWTDLVVTVGISLYIVWLSLPPLKKCIRVLLASVPEGISLREVAAVIENTDEVRSVSHLHVWSVDEGTVALQAIVEMRAEASLQDAALLRERLCERLKTEHRIQHASIEVLPLGHRPVLSLSDGKDATRPVEHDEPGGCSNHQVGKVRPRPTD